MANEVQPWSVYIVRCVDGTYYTGSTPDVERRIVAHNAGKGAKYTRVRLPVVLMYQEVCLDHSAALKREHTIKQLSRAEKQQLVGSYDT